MTVPHSLDQLLVERTVWRGRAANSQSKSGLATGVEALDSVLPLGGWPPSSLTELLIPVDGIGELRLLWPTLARLTRDGGRVVLVAPPYIPYAPAWHAAGIDLGRLQVIRADAKQAAWAAEQCLRSSACAAVLCWPWRADDRTLRRLQVAAETGQTPCFAFRPHTAAVNASPAALRITIDAVARQLRVLKCRGALAPPQPIGYARH